jgi:tetratricopeptide (TPR) repeat protein
MASQAPGPGPCCIKWLNSMSYINEALKKAQELKDAGFTNYLSAPKSSDSGRGRFFAKMALFTLPVLILITILFSMHIWRDSQNAQKVQLSRSADSTATKTGDNASAKKELYDKALSLYKEGKTGEAKKIYEAILGLDPGYVEVLNNLSIIYIHDKEFDTAKEHLEKAVRLNPSYVESYYNLACLYAIRGEVDKGVGYLEKAISLDKGVREWAKNDSDLQNLKRSDAFKKMLLRDRNK